jgi:hypothetical protein
MSTRKKSKSKNNITNAEINKFVSQSLRKKAINKAVNSQLIPTSMATPLNHRVEHATPLTFDLLELGNDVIQEAIPVRGNHRYTTFKSLPKGKKGNKRQYKNVMFAPESLSLPIDSASFQNYTIRGAPTADIRTNNIMMMTPFTQRLSLAISIIQNDINTHKERKSELLLHKKPKSVLREIDRKLEILNDKLYDLSHINLQQPITKKMNKQINHILFIYGFT